VIGLPGEEKRCFLEDLFLFLEDAVLAAQAAELISLLAREPRRLAVVDVSLSDPSRKGLGAHPDLSRGCPQGPAAGAMEPDRLLAELGWESYSFCHVDPFLGTPLCPNSGC
jgi:hypothetical protein